MQHGVFKQDGELVIGPAQADRIGAADFGEPFASRFLPAEDHAAVDDFSRAGIADTRQAHLHSESSSKLDFDVANVARLIDPPGDRGDDRRRKNRQHQENNRGDGLAQAGGSRETSLPPSVLGDQIVCGRRRPLHRARIDESAVSLNYRLQQALRLACSSSKWTCTIPGVRGSHRAALACAMHRGAPSRNRARPFRPSVSPSARAGHRPSGRADLG